MASIATLASLAVRRRSAGWAQKILGWFRRSPKTDRLYILRVDFPVDEKIGRQLEAALDPLRKKYELDFLVLEPGMKLSRFDDI